jgi:nucleotide-binding universal stress UspA family protein
MAAILVPTDGTESARAAMRVAFELARASGDPLLFVTVWRELRGDFGLPLPFTAEVERDWARETLAAAAAEAEAADLEAETVSRHGSPADEICAVARERGVRMIVIGSHGFGPLAGAIFGSVSSGVLDHAPCPVLVVPEPPGAKPGVKKGAGDVARV